jgi:hypothetical protein
MAEATGVEFIENNDTFEALRTHDAHKANPDLVGTAVPNMNSRQFMQHFRGSFTAPAFTVEVAPCEESYPEVINVYTDGSVKNPAHRLYALGGAGVWWPGRCLTDHPLSTHELEATGCSQESNGVKFWGLVGGPRIDSTRTEIAGAIQAIVSNCSTHVGSDSDNFVQMLRQIVSSPNPLSFKPKRPWELTSDGDLWKIMVHAIAQKGKHAVWATWVKGHATNKHVEDGIITERNRINNYVVDAVADIGVGMHSEGILTLAKVYVRRRKWFEIIVSKTHSLYLAIHAKDKMLRESIAKQLVQLHGGKGTSLHITLPIHLEYADENASRTLELYRPAAFDTADCLVHTQVWGFLSSFRFAPTAMNQKGISWIELYIMFEFVGGSVDLDGSCTITGESRTRLELLVNTFRRIVMQVVDVCLPEGDRSLFQPCYVTRNRFKALAFSNALPSITCLPVLTLGQSCTITLALLCSRMKITQHVKANLEQGNLKLPCH